MTKPKDKDRVQMEINNKKLHADMKTLAIKQRRTMTYMIELAFKDCLEKYKNKPA